MEAIVDGRQAIEITDLFKSYGDVHAVQGVTLSAPPGEVLALLGPNGAGKSTIISVLAGLIAPTRGDAAIMGYSVTGEAARARSQLGLVPQEIALYQDLSARDNLLFWGKMYGLRGTALRTRVGEVLAMIGLEERSRERISHYSGGMKRRVNIGAALLHRPPVIIMDEPTVGIDPQSRRHILDNVRQLKAHGSTVLYTTHNMEEAAELADHIAIIDQGRVVAYGTHADLVRLVGEQTRLEVSIHRPGERALEAWRAVEGVSEVVGTEGQITALVTDADLVLPRLFDAAAVCDVRIASIDVQEPNLETVFLHLTGRGLRDQAEP